jgi:predicted anti-sigma-YlaC factor YlaD
MTCAENREALGAYVLGTLERADAAAVREHLLGCADCRAQLELLSVLPAFLALVPPDLAIAGPPKDTPSDLMLGRLLSAVAAERRHRRRVQWLAAAAAVLVVLLGVGTALLIGGRGGSPAPAPAAAGPQPSVVATVDPVTHVQANMTMRRTAWGSRMSIGLAGVPAGETCSLVAIGPGGERETAATYKVPASGWRDDQWFHVEGSVGLLPDDVRSVEVVASGHTLVTLWP